MSARTLRIVCIAFILGSLAIRLQAIRDRDQVVTAFDMSAAIKAALTSANMQLVANPRPPHMVLSVVVYFKRHDCSEVSAALPFSMHTAALPLLERAVGKPGYSRRIMFFERTWNEPTRIAIYAEWLKQAVLSTVGASPYRPIKVALAIADPPNCAAETIDWRHVWLKELAPSTDVRAAPSTASVGVSG